MGCPIKISGHLYCSDNNIEESEIFLYNYSSEQIRQYYIGKNLNEKLLVGLSEESEVGIKRKKL